MPRDGDPARRRLMQAALELFAERGFDATTAAAIASRAGVTERTFFRHFPDKREVLFDGQQRLGAALDAAVAAAPRGLDDAAVLRRAFAAVTGMLEENRPFSEPRRAVIAASPALREREAAKHASLTRGLADALARRGIGAARAALAAGAGLAVLGHAVEEWFAAPGTRLADHLDRAFAALRALGAPDPPAPEDRAASRR